MPLLPPGGALFRDHPTSRLSGVTWIADAVALQLEVAAAKMTMYKSAACRQLFNVRHHHLNGCAPSDEDFFTHVFGRAPLPTELDELAENDLLEEAPRLSGGMLLELLGIGRIRPGQDQIPRVEIPRSQAVWLTFLLPAVGWYLARLARTRPTREEWYDHLNRLEPYRAPETVGVRSDTILDNVRKHAELYRAVQNRFVDRILEEVDLSDSDVLVVRPRRGRPKRFAGPARAASSSSVPIDDWWANSSPADRARFG